MEHQLTYLSIIVYIKIINACMPVLGFVLHYEAKVFWNYDIWITSTMLPFLCEDVSTKKSQSNIIGNERNSFFSYV